MEYIEETDIDKSEGIKGRKEVKRRVTLWGKRTSDVSGRGRKDRRRLGVC
jgi:hypothetical protein